LSPVSRVLQLPTLATGYASLFHIHYPGGMNLASLS
jgi:hypothetical protein